MKRLVNGKEMDLTPSADVKVTEAGDRLQVRSSEGVSSALVVRRGDEVLVSYGGRQYSVSPIRHGSGEDALAASGVVKALLPSQVVEVFVEEGQVVEDGQKLLVVEAMKMQQTISAPYRGTVDQIPVSAGDQVSEGQLLALIGKLPE